MPIGNVDRVEAALAALTREDVAALPPARRRSLQATLGAWQCLCDDILHPPARPASGVLEKLNGGDRSL